MAQRFKCGKCNQLILADEKYLGKTVICPTCKTHLKIPGPQTSHAAASPPADPLINKKIAHYHIEALLGEGGMGKVYRARNLRLNKTCALKVLPEEFARQDASRLDRFLREAQSAAKVEHPNVLPVHFVGQEKNVYFIEMQYVDGGSLEDILEQKGKLPPAEATRLIRDVAVGLGAAHANGIVHRDIKPSNVMMMKTGQVKVADFGLAQMGEMTSRLTLSGMIMGTPLYMSPEQGAGKSADLRSDIYSLGVVYYQLLTGRLPFSADTPVALIHQHIYSPLPDITLVAPEIPEDIATIVSRMMAKKPEDRYQSCNDLIRDLQGVLVPQARIAKPAKKSPSAMYALIGVIVVAALIAAGVVLFKFREKAVPAPDKGTVASTPAPVAPPAPPTAQTLPAIPSAPSAEVPATAPTAKSGPKSESEPDSTAPEPAVTGEFKTTTSAATGEFPSAIHREAVGLFLAEQRKGMDKARTITVREDGKGDSKAIGEAISAAEPGSIIEIADSATYKEELTIGPVRNNLWLRAAKGQRPVLDAEGQREQCVTIQRDTTGVILDGLAFTGAKKQAVRVGKATETVVANCLFEKNWGSVELRDSGAAYVLANTFRANDGPCVQTWMVKCLVAADNAFLEMPSVSGLSRACLRIETTAESYVSNNLFVRASNPLVITSSRCTAAHNTAYETNGAWAVLNFSSEGNIVRDNVAAHIKSGEVVSIGTQAIITGQTVDFNAYYGGGNVGRMDRPGTATKWYKKLPEWQEALGFDKNSISASAKFANMQKGDFRLRVGSPCEKKASDGRDMGVVFDMSALELPLWDGKPLFHRPTKGEVADAQARADAKALLDELKPINFLIDEYQYDDALGRARILETKYGDLLRRKTANIQLLKALHKTAIAMIASGKKQPPMKEMSRRFGFAGDIVKADEKNVYGSVAGFKKEWAKFKKEEVGNLYRALGGGLVEGLDLPKGAADSRLHVALAVLAVEGAGDEKALDDATAELAKAAAKGLDCAPYTDYFDRLKNAISKSKETGPTEASASTAEKAKSGVAFGPIRQWSLIGPFPWPEGTPWEDTRFPEKEIALDKEYDVDGKAVGWKPCKTDDPNAVVNLKSFFKRSDRVVAYAYAEITAKKECDCFFKMGSDDGILCWLNGRLIFKFTSNRPCVPDSDVVPVHLLEGTNKVLLKITNVYGEWAFSFSVAAERSFSAGGASGGARPAR